MKFPLAGLAAPVLTRVALAEDPQACDRLEVEPKTARTDRHASNLK